MLTTQAKTKSFYNYSQTYLSYPQNLVKKKANEGFFILNLLTNEDVRENLVRKEREELITAIKNIHLLTI